MDAAVYYPAAFMNRVKAAVALRHAVFSPPVEHARVLPPASFADDRTRYGYYFERAMRMPEDAFMHLVGNLRPLLPSRGHTAELRTAMALRYLGGGSYLDICATFGVPASTLDNALWEVVNAVNASPAMDFNFRLQDPAWRQQTSSGFEQSRRSPFDNILGAVDGIAVRQEQPLASDVPCVADYYSRKGFYAYKVQAMCNADNELIWMSCKSPGSVHDSTPFGLTALGQMLMIPRDAVTSQLIADGYCIVGDEAYAAGEVMAVPWPSGGGGDKRKDSYNFFQSSSRIHVEQACGMLVWRWGVFWRPLRVPFFKLPSLICACFKLHNHCRRYAATSTTALAPYRNDRDGGSVFFLENDVACPSQRGRRRDRERSHLRVRMTRRVEHLGLLRPNVRPLY